MHIVVSMKRVPDSAQIRIHPVTHTLMRQGVPSIINPYDLFALEEALRLRDQWGGQVTIITMGAPTATEIQRRALTMGADQAVLLTDRVFAGADTLATSYTLSMGIKRIAQEYGPVDIVFTGKQTIDGDTAQVGPGIATRLGFTLLTYVEKIEWIDPDKKVIRVHRRAEGGVQVLESRLPCLITMLEGTNEPRRGNLEEALRAARSDISTWNHQEIGIEDIKQIGLRGSPTVVTKVFAPEKKSTPAQMIEVENKTMNEVAMTAVETLLTNNETLKELLA